MTQPDVAPLIVDPAVPARDASRLRVATPVDVERSPQSQALMGLGCALTGYLVTALGIGAAKLSPPMVLGAVVAAAVLTWACVEVSRTVRHHLAEAARRRWDGHVADVTAWDSTSRGLISLALEHLGSPGATCEPVRDPKVWEVASLLRRRELVLHDASADQSEAQRLIDAARDRVWALRELAA